jgi:flagellar basal body rod protein FlgF
MESKKKAKKNHENKQSQPQPSTVPKVGLAGVLEKFLVNNNNTVAATNERTRQLEIQLKIEEIQYCTGIAQ